MSHEMRTKLCESLVNCHESIDFNATPERLLLAALKLFLIVRGKELDTSGSGELVISCKGGEDLHVPTIFLLS